ncbi:MAG: DUF1385 domain-containing protein [Candidatus Paceibacterota bacterium]|jgi:uncharacterized protein YqhQ
MKVNVIGGVSDSGRISIESDLFISTARINRHGDIVQETKRKSPFRVFLSKCSRFPIPRLVSVALQMLGNSKDLLSSVGGFAFIYIVVFLVGKYIPRKPLLPLNSWYGDLLFASFSIIFFLLYARFFVAKYHAAEHMAINSYEKTGSVDIDDIRKGKRIDIYCGGRFVFPMILMVILLNALNLDSAIAYIIGLGCIFEIDSRVIKWSRIPVFAQASWLLQKYVTTQKPGAQELLVAQRALQGLVAAHEELGRESSKS